MCIDRQPDGDNPVNIDFAPDLKDDRNAWYNPDFIRLMADRWELRNALAVLDVGCGHFHWSRQLAPYLPVDACVTGIDIAALNREQFAAIRRLPAFAYRPLAYVQAKAQQLPFAAETFDIVTCQTLLIHLHRPHEILLEMKRVLKYGGKLICAEPNNAVQAMMQDVSSAEDTLRQKLKRIKTRLKKEQKKKTNQGGNDSIGELVPLMMQAMGMQSIRCYLNDKIVTLRPAATRDAEQKKKSPIRHKKKTGPIGCMSRQCATQTATMAPAGADCFSLCQPTMLFLTSSEKRKPQR